MQHLLHFGQLQRIGDQLIDDCGALEQGYVRQDGVNGMEAYVPQRAAATRWFAAPGQSPELWKPLW